MRKRKGETAMSCEEMRRKELMRKIYD